jgi:hypothetical protein
MSNIKVTVSDKITHINSQKSTTTIDTLRPLVAEFVASLEVDNVFNQELYNKIVDMDINRQVFDKMINSIESFMEFDDVPDQVNFPYEEWLPQILLTDDNYKQ